MNKNYKIPETDLCLCPVGLGTVSAGLYWDGMDADYMIDAYMDMGGNFIDSARVYSDWIPPETGRSERVIGDWVRRSGKRNQVLLVTKGGHPKLTGLKEDMHISRMSESDMRYDLELSLKALHTDVIDIYFYHRDNRLQSVEEEIEVMEQFRKEGKIRYYGCSNWEADRIIEADEYCKKSGYRGFVANQALLNIGSKYMKPLADDTMISVGDELFAYHKNNARNLAMPYTGVAGGFFHHYLEKGEDSVKDSPYYTDENLKIAGRCKVLMDKYHASVSQVVLGFFTQQPFACIPLYGPKNVEQLVDAMGILEIDFAPADYAF